MLEQADSEEISCDATPVEGIPWWLSSNESACNAGATGDVGLISGWGRCPGEEHSNPFQYSCLENSMDRGAWWATVYRGPKSRTQLKRLSMHTHTHTHTHTSPLEFARNPPLGMLRRAAHKKVSHQRHSAAKPPKGFSRGSCWPLCAAGCRVLEESGAEQLCILQKACAVEVVHALGTGPHSSSWLIWSTKFNIFKR